MAKITIDLTEATEGSVLLPKGVYTAKIDKTEVKKSKAQQNMLNIKFSIEGKGSLYSNVMLEGAGAFKFIELINALGGVKGIEAGKKISFDPDKLIGKTLGIFTDIEEYDGKEKTIITQFVLKESTSEVVEEEEEEVPTNSSDDEEEFDLDF